MNEELGLTLQQAAEQYSDRAKWNTYQEAAERGVGPGKAIHYIDANGVAVHDRTAGGTVLRGTPSVVEKERAGRDVAQDIRQQFERGDLVATGMQCPLGTDSLREVIPRHLWPLVTLNYRNSAIVGPGLHIIDIRVRRSLDIVQHQATTMAMVREEHGPSYPGRRSIMRAIEAEMRRRAATEKLAPTLAQASRDLAEWVKERFQEQQTPTAKTIENALRSLYQSLKGSSSPVN